MNRHLKIVLVEGASLIRDAIIGHLVAIDPEIEMFGTANGADVPSEPLLNGIIVNADAANAALLKKLSDLREGFPSTRLIALVPSVSADQAAKLIALGTAGILTTSMSGLAVIHALRLISVGEVFIPAMIGRAEPAGAEEIPAALDRRDTLTARDLQVLELLCQGLTNRNIADALSVAEVTVKMQLGRVFKKLHATNRADAVRIALTKHLVTDSDKSTLVSGIPAH